MGTTALESQARDHGYTVLVKVEKDGTATVTLKDTYAGHTFVGGSDDETGPNRYETALRVALTRALDFSYRDRPERRPKLGRSEYDGLPGDWHEHRQGDGDPGIPGGIGCTYCDTLWATAASVEFHERTEHPDELARDAYIAGGSK